MSISPKDYLQSRIRDYYKMHVLDIPGIEYREFGYGEYGKKISSRHLAFQNNLEFNNFLTSNAPFYVSYSSAYYKKPSARPMENKELLGADMVFEFDSDDIPTDCKKIHDSWVCPKCNNSGKGRVLVCPECKAKTDISEWICDLCLEQTKRQTKKLYQILTTELRFDYNDLNLMYSGHKGFHIKIKGDKIYSQKQNQRVEIMNYISEDGINFKALGFMQDNKGSIKYLGKDFGKGFKYLNLAAKLVKSYDVEKLKGLFDISTKSFNKLIENRESISNNILKGEFPKIKADSVSLWYNFLDNIKELQNMYIDKQTTIDLHKILRCEDTIHGGSMLVSKKLKFEDIDKFNPFSDAFSFNGDYLKIHLKKVPKLLLGGRTIGPYENQIVELPVEYSLYFLAKGASNEIIL